MQLIQSIPQSTATILKSSKRNIFLFGDVHLGDNDDGIAYAKTLLLKCTIPENENSGIVEIKIGLPESTKIIPAFIQKMKAHFEDLKPATPYKKSGTNTEVPVSFNENGMKKIAVKNHGISIRHENPDSNFSKFYRKDQVTINMLFWV